MHVDEDFAFVEFLPVPGQDAVRIVGTNVSNPLTPLVRYDTGDLATLDPEPCSCGRPGRLVRQIDGRREDFVITASGARMGRMDHVFKDLVRVREAQIRQRERGAMDVLVVPGPGYGPRDEQELRDELALRVGGDMRVNVTTVERIPRTASGKLRFVVSEMDEGAIERGRPEAVR